MQPWTSLRHRTTTTITRCPQKTTEEGEQGPSSSTTRRPNCAIDDRRLCACASCVCLPLCPVPALSPPCPGARPGVPGACMWTPGTGIQSVPSLYRVALVGVVPWPYPPPVLPRDHRPSRYRTRTHPSRYRTGSPTPSSGPVVNPQPQNSTGPVAKSYKTDRYRTATHSDSRRRQSGHG